MPETFSPPLLALDGSFVEDQFGFNPEVDIGSVPADIWDFGAPTESPVYPWPTAPAATTLISTSAADAAGGTGARTIRVIGIADPVTFTEVAEEVTLTGLVAVPLVNQFYRINRMYNLTAGSNGVNVGDIRALHGASVISQISADRGSTLQAIYTIPKIPDGARYFLSGLSASVSRQPTASVTMVMEIRVPRVNAAWTTRIIYALHSQGTTALIRGTLPQGFELEAGTDIRVRVTECTTNNTGIGADFEIQFVPSGVGKLT